MGFFNRLFGCSKYHVTYGERLIMGRLEELEAKQEEVVVLLKTIDEQVEQMFDVIKNSSVSEAAAVRLSAGLDKIKEAAAAIAVDSEPAPAPEPTPEPAPEPEAPASPETPSEG